MTAIRHPEPVWDEHWKGYELAADDTHRYLWLWHGYNIRLIAVPAGDETGYDHGWCYPRDPQLVQAAVAEWDPDTQDEPTGWHKRPTHPVRRAPRRDEQQDYNRPRCVHGCYIADGCRTINCPDATHASPPAKETPVAALTADEFNARYPVGTPVVAYPLSRPEDNRPDLFQCLETVTRSPAWALGHGAPVVSVDGYTGGIALTHIDPVTERHSA